MAIMSAIREQRFEAIVEREREWEGKQSGSLGEFEVETGKAGPCGPCLAPMEKIKADKVMAGCPS